MTEADEFNAIYALQVISIPTNRPIARADLTDLIYGSENEKFEAIATEVMVANWSAHFWWVPLRWRLLNAYPPFLSVKVFPTKY